MYFIFTSENCPRCTTLKSILESKQITPIEVNVRANESAAMFLRNKGYRGVPVLFFLDEWDVMTDVTGEFI
jgi:glutaredoxin